MWIIQYIAYKFYHFLSEKRYIFDHTKQVSEMSKNTCAWGMQAYLDMKRTDNV